ncbi:MAG: citramalate synthase [Gammaproteobacteria bacterium]|nr:citramalate synthase [Gammaproteobacteria bacterium]
MRQLPTSVEIRDDTMREGLQIENKDISVEEKLRLLDALGDTGLKVISIGSFVSPKWTPQMANIDELAERFEPKPGVKYTAAVFNRQGFERADKFYPKIDVRSRDYMTHVEVGAIFAMRNYNRTPDQLLRQGDSTIDAAKRAGVSSGGIAFGNPFGSNFEGDFSLEQSLSVLEAAIDRWHARDLTVSICRIIDDMGACLPDQLIDMFTAIQQRWPEITNFGLHLHNQRGVTNICYYEALKFGVTHFETSLGGLGGCPYCGNGRSAGHVPTEDFAFLCEELGVETGLDLDKLIEAAAIAEEVVGHPLWGHVSKAGPRPRGERLYPKNMPFVETLDEAAHFRKGPSVYDHQLRPWKEDSALLTSPD